MDAAASGDVAIISSTRHSIHETSCPGKATNSISRENTKTGKTALFPVKNVAENALALAQIVAQVVGQTRVPQAPERFFL